MAQFTCSFLSYTLKRTVDIGVIIPSPVFSDIMGENPSHTQKEKYPVLYLLPGYTNDYSSWLRYARAERYAEEKNIAIVAVSGENNFYTNRPNVMNDDLHYDFIARELPDFICGMFPVSCRREDTYIAGLSMGGYGALLHAMGNPERYCAFGAFSAGHEKTGEQGPADRVTDGVLDLSEILKSRGGEMERLPKGYMSCGEEDEGHYGLNLELKDAYQQAGGDLYWESCPGYGHEWAFWDAQLEKFLDWIPRTDSFAGVKRSV